MLAMYIKLYTVLKEIAILKTRKKSFDYNKTHYFEAVIFRTHSSPPKRPDFEGVPGNTLDLL